MSQIGKKIKLQARKDLNLYPSGSEPDTLSIELHAYITRL